MAVAQKERFSRLNNDERFPKNAVTFCLQHAGQNGSELDAVVLYDTPITKFARLLESYLAVALHGWTTFPRALPPWLGERLNIRSTIRYVMPGLPEETPILFAAHHQSHVASSFFPSPVRSACSIRRLRHTAKSSRDFDRMF